MNKGSKLFKNFLRSLLLIYDIHLETKLQYIDHIKLYMVV